MCGRFILTASGEEIAEAFELPDAPILKPRFNIAPSQPIAVVGWRPGTRARGLAELRWGLAAPSGGRPQINVRSETAARRPAFRDAFARRRCLVPATGFYEWQRSPAERARPWLFRRSDAGLFALAALWEPATEPGTPASCAILTTTPNELARAVHDRMPLILDPADYGRWLDPERIGAAELQDLLRPYVGAAMDAYPVSLAVNDARFDDPSCLLPA
jgi:putative SOS response-associated peptidase YedK